MARIRMFSRLDSFIQSHMSTSTSATWSADDLKQQLVIKVIEDVLANSNIGLVKPMAKKDWKKLVKSITEQHRPSPEREGVHPRLFQILKNISRGSLYQWVYDQSNEDSDGIITIPDFSKFQAGDHILDLEAKCEKLILRAVQQSEGHLVCKIRGNIEMSGVLNSESEYFGICLGSDGIQLAVSTITVSLDSFIITRTSLRNPVELWPPSTETPADETRGVTILRSLLAQPPAALTRSPPVQHFPLLAGTVRPVSVLGRGAFWTAFRCVVDGSSDELCVKKAIFSMADRVVRNDQLVQLQREEAVLAAFSSSTVLLPTLFPGSQAVSVSSPFLAMLPVGVDLPAYTASLSKEKRIAQAPVLLHALQVALASAHALGFCHCDLRPENVIRAGSTFTIIDWGLACKEGEPMHHHRGSTLFFAEAILQGMLSSVKGTPYFSCFDLESARYVAYGFLCGQRHLIPPGWALSSLEELIVDRKHELQTAGL